MISYPVAIDNDFKIWRGFDNMYWPAHYFIDAKGQIRHHHFGEGDYQGSERVIQRLLAESGRADPKDGFVRIGISGIATAAVQDDDLSPETYVGYKRAENFVSPGGIAQDKRQAYAVDMPRRNEWGLRGEWTVVGEHASLDSDHGSIVYRYRARDLNLVLGPGPDGKPVRFRVTTDGRSLGDSHGIDTDANGNGVVKEQRLYQLVRERAGVEERTFEIEFLDPGAQVYAFTFG